MVERGHSLWSNSQRENLLMMSETYTLRVDGGNFRAFKILEAAGVEWKQVRNKNSKVYLL